MTHNLDLRNITKHIEIDKYFIQEKIDLGVICISYILTKEQIADMLTKGLSKGEFDKHLNKLAMEDIYKPT